MTAAVETIVTPGDLMSPRQRLCLVLVLGSLIAIGPLTIDMYLPAKRSGNWPDSVAGRRSACEPTGVADRTSNAVSRGSQACP